MASARFEITRSFDHATGGMGCGTPLPVLFKLPNAGDNMEALRHGGRAGAHGTLCKSQRKTARRDAEDAKDAEVKQ